MKGDPNKSGFSTRPSMLAKHPIPPTGSVTVPIYQTSTYVQDELGQHKGYEYARVQNPTREASRTTLQLSRIAWLATPSLRASQPYPALLTLTRTGDHVVCSQNVYGGTYRFFTQILSATACASPRSIRRISTPSKVPCRKRLAWSTSRRRPTP